MKMKYIFIKTVPASFLFDKYPDEKQHREGKGLFTLVNFSPSLGEAKVGSEAAHSAY